MRNSVVFAALSALGLAQATTANYTIDISSISLTTRCMCLLFFVFGCSIRPAVPLPLVAPLALWLAMFRAASAFSFAPFRCLGSSLALIQSPLAPHWVEPRCTEYHVYLIIIYTLLLTRLSYSHMVPGPG